MLQRTGDAVAYKQARQHQGSGHRCALSDNPTKQATVELRPRRLLRRILGVFLLLLVLLVSAWSLGQPVIQIGQDLFGYGGAHSDEVTGSRDLFHSGAPIGGRWMGETYGEYDSRRDRTVSASFFGFGCMEDCREQKAGYRWAVRHNVSDIGDCAGLSWAFLEGCVAYAARQA